MNENLLLSFAITGSLRDVGNSLPEGVTARMSCPTSLASISRLSALKPCNCGQPWIRLDVMQPKGTSRLYAIVHHAGRGSSSSMPRTSSRS